MHCSKADLVFSDYSWQTASNEAGTNATGEVVLDRRDGYQMLKLLNNWAASWLHTKSLSFFNNLERVLRQLVPARLKTMSEVRAWVELHTPRL
jgi:hypothetical protein